MWKASLLLFSLLHPATCSLLLPRASKTCTTFEVKGDAYTVPANDTHRISVGATCSGTLNSTEPTCPIVADGTITEASSLDPQVSNSTRDDLFKLVGSIVHKKLNESVTERVADNRTYQLKPGQSGYVGFTAELQCWNGTVSGCGEGYEVQNDTVITLCTTWYDTTGALSGTANIVGTDKQTADGMQTNPAEEATSGAARLLSREGSFWVVFGWTCAFIMVFRL